MIQQLLQRQKMMLSKKDLGVDGGGMTKHAAIIDKVIKTHARSVHYKVSDNLRDTLLASVKDMPISILEEAYRTWNDKGKERKKSYHPNYFLGIAKRLYEEMPNKNLKTLWGKGI